MQLTMELVESCYKKVDRSKIEQAYATIQKECLSIVVPCRKFDKYLYGSRDVTIQTEHKPLEAILKKILDACPKRLQRIRLALQRYNIKIQYITGKANLVTDALSRSSLRQSTEEPNDYARRVKLESISHHDTSKTTDLMAECLRDATEKDDHLQAVIKAIRSGWESRDQQTHCYWNFRDEIVEDQGLIYKGSAVLVPKELKAKFLKKKSALLALGLRRYVQTGQGHNTLD